MRRVIALAALMILTACTPSQIAAWWSWRDVDPSAADAYADQVGANYAAHLGDRCGQWYAAALDAGFTEAQWPTVSRVMHAESNCTPSAHNPSGATGLMQVMPMWADDCGGAPVDMFDPAFNLACAVHVLDVSSWYAWSTY